MNGNIGKIEGFYNAPPYALSRNTVAAGGVYRDFTPILHKGVWNHAFADDDDSVSVIDWEDRWRSYWDAAASLIGTGTDYSPDRFAIELQAFFPDQTQWSRGVVANIPPGLIREYGLNAMLELGLFWPDTAVEHLTHGLGGDTPIAALAGVIVNGGDSVGRPSLTLMVSGPGGAREAATMIAYALMKKGLNSGVCIRTVRDDSSGVVKLVFAPELVLASGATRGFGIDWSIWKTFAKNHPELEWHRACLVWCDQVAAVVDGLLKDVPLMVDQVFFDYIRAAVLFPGHSLEAILEDPDELSDNINSYPYELLLGKS